MTIRVDRFFTPGACVLAAAVLRRVFSGGAGGYLAGLGPLIGEVAGVQPAAITFEKSDGSLHAEVANALSMSSDQLVGMDAGSLP